MFDFKEDILQLTCDQSKKNTFEGYTKTCQDVIM